jgi:beta-galactosidase
LKEEGMVVESGVIESPEVGPAGSDYIDLGITGGVDDPTREYFLNLTVVTREDAPLVPAGHPVASAQFAMNPSAASKISPVEFTNSGKDKVSFVESKTSLLVQSPKGEILFDMATGYITSCSLGGIQMISEGPRPNFWRAPIENDFGNRMEMRCGMWKSFGAQLELQTLFVVETDSVAAVMTEFLHPGNGSTYKAEYYFNNMGEVLVKVTFNPSKDSYPEVPRFGMKMVLPRGYDQLKYYGRGPHENYIDRNRSSYVGVYNSTVDEQYVPYISNGENGNKTDVRWLTLTNRDGHGIMIKGSPTIDFSALHFSQDQLDREVRDGAHTIDLERSENIFLNVDWKQMGVGGDNAWGARTHVEYVLPAVPMEYSYIISPL